MGDFTGFSFGNWHSTDPNTGVVEVYRVSGGDRYDEELHPEINDRTAEVPGLNGQYYFGSDFGTRSFDIEIAFDHLTEEQFRKLRTVFGTRQIKKLIFDERPYKYYMAKLESPIELSYVCFDEPGYTWQQGNGIGRTQAERENHDYKVYNNTKQRIYKGEGKMTFICYFPFAKSVYKQLPAGEEESGWAVSSGILSESDYIPYDTYTVPQTGTPYIKVYNPGDIETGFRLYYPFTNNQINNQITLRYQRNNSSDYDILVINPLTAKQNDKINGNPIYDEGILIDTNSELITGVSNYADDQYTTSGNLYNEYIEAGYFFKIQPKDIQNEAKIEIINGNTGIRIFYDYLYF